MYNKWLKNWLLGSFLFYILLCMFLFFYQRHLMYVPNATPPDPAQYEIEGMYEPVTVETADGLTLTGWYFPAVNAPLGKTIVLYHGNAWHKGARVFKAKHYHAAGYHVLLASWRGFGGNPGKPTEQGLYNDAQAFLDWLTARGVQERDIILYGESLGTGIASEMALRAPGIHALILESPYTSFMDLAKRSYFFVPNEILLKDRYDNLSRIGGVSAPVLILQGALDVVVPAEQAKRVFEAANQPKELKLYPAASHNNLYSFGAAEDVIGYLQSIQE